MTSDPDDPPIPSFLYSAETHSGADRFDSWQGEVAQLFEVAPQSDAQAYRGSLNGHLMDGIVVARTLLAAQEFRRDRRLVAQSGLDAYLLQLYTGGGFQGYADDKEMLVRAGDVCVFDLTGTLSTRAPDSSNVTLVIPKLLVDRHWNARAPVNGLVISGQTALGQLMGSHLTALSKAVPRMTAREAPLVADTTSRMLAGCLAHFTTDDGQANGALQQALFERAMRYIRANLHSPELSPETISKALKVSRPHLFRAFRNRGGIMHNILDQRLRLAFGELTNPANRNESISAIAFRCGFISDSHFTRIFREAYGMRPSDIRGAPPVPPVAADTEPSLAAWLSMPGFAGG